MSRPRTDRWADADRLLREFLPPFTADRWWITPHAELGGACPIVLWESAQHREVESLIRAQGRAIRSAA